MPASFILRLIPAALLAASIVHPSPVCGASSPDAAGKTPAGVLSSVRSAMPCLSLPARPDLRAQLAGLVAAIPRDSHYGTVPAVQLARELSESRPFLLDVREPAELESDGCIEGSVNIPLRRLIANIDRLPARDRPIVVYCTSSHRGAMAMAGLRLLGYADVRNLAFGFGAWWKAGLPVVESPSPREPSADTSPVGESPALLQMLGDLFARLPGDFHATTVGALQADLSAGKRPALVDVRRAEQYEGDGHIAGAVSVPFEALFDGLDRLPSRDARMVVYCASGHRSSVAALGLRLLGYESVTSLDGGVEAWTAAGLPLAGARIEGNRFREETSFKVEEHRLEMRTGPLPEPPSEEILAGRRLWRESGQVGDRIEEFNRRVGPLGYRLERQADGGKTVTYFLTRGQEPLLQRLTEIDNLSLSRDGQRFICSARIRVERGERIVFIRDGRIEEPRSYGEYYSDVLDGPAPFFLGTELFWCDLQLQGRIEVEPSYYKVFIRTEGRVLYEDRFYQMAPSFPVVFKPLGETWLLEISDWNRPSRVIIDGRNINKKAGYWGVWEYRLIDGIPFFFGKKHESDHFRLVYSGAEIASFWYDFIGYDGVWGVEGNDRMIWFQARRGDAWYYVEAGRFPSAR